MSDYNAPSIVVVCPAGLKTSEYERVRKRYPRMVTAWTHDLPNPFCSTGYLYFVRNMPTFFVRVTAKVLKYEDVVNEMFNELFEGANNG